MVEGSNTSSRQRLGDRGLRSTQRVFETHPAIVPLRYQQTGPSLGQQQPGSSGRCSSALPLLFLFCPLPLLLLCSGCEVGVGTGGLRGRELRFKKGQPACQRSRY